MIILSERYSSVNQISLNDLTDISSDSVYFRQTNGTSTTFYFSRSPTRSPSDLRRLPSNRKCWCKFSKGRSCVLAPLQRMLDLHDLGMHNVESEYQLVSKWDEAEAALGPPRRKLTYVEKKEKITWVQFWSYHPETSNKPVSSRCRSWIWSCSWSRFFENVFWLFLNVSSPDITLIMQLKSFFSQLKQEEVSIGKDKIGWERERETSANSWFITMHLIMTSYSDMFHLFL